MNCFTCNTSISSISAVVLKKIHLLKRTEKKLDWKKIIIIGILKAIKRKSFKLICQNIVYTLANTCVCH